MNREWHGGTADRGQATVELALALPMVCLLLLAMVQVAVIGRDQLAVQLAAREAARAARAQYDMAREGVRPEDRAAAEAARKIQLELAAWLATSGKS